MPAVFAVGFAEPTLELRLLKMKTSLKAKRKAASGMRARETTSDSLNQHTAARLDDAYHLAGVLRHVRKQHDAELRSAMPKHPPATSWNFRTIGTAGTTYD
jgi:hypothetical protein